MLRKSIEQILQNYPGAIYGFTSIEYSDFSEEYKSALVIAVPYDKQLTINDYSEEEFEKSIGKAREEINTILKEIENLLIKECVKYWIPSAVQNNETDLAASFSLKYAAAKAGIGWIGKNDVIITKQYGPRIRLSAILIDYPFLYNIPYTRSECPPDCELCIKVCPYKALKGVTWNSDTYRAEIIDYHLCNEKRSLYIERHGRKSSCGLCMVVCPFGTERDNV